MRGIEGETVFFARFYCFWLFFTVIYIFSLLFFSLLFSFPSTCIRLTSFSFSLCMFSNEFLRSFVIYSYILKSSSSEYCRSVVFVVSMGSVFLTLFLSLATK